MKKIELFEPAMCCSTGVCGPAVNQDLLMITSAFAALKDVPNVAADRYNLSNDPKVFSQRPEILAAIKDDTDSVLPITVVDGTIVKTGAYPTLAELSTYTGLVFVPASQDGGCCGDSGCC
ncbi:arsenite efflux transporter metallochaperone ArsD [Loigolactobacillus backii]|uniref:Transcriptional regulator n=1 Tax=Loigolactobacillus backii TaxID=375175 RepID=A0A192GY54_9LACO|nr:arsenite efflux transporter metallochaperone ArsD [Loigolactobacillus backii]ANK61444.1 transcriptional regulator [Loigolactobacillus backii]ANK69357.1 transcriptional regulator [Loigolactobacillus backii]MDA5387785.1 arsenite efflux transporter metallochaperone ArsD [Loigolactobacillus backii]MDA5390885.1 arsenite efflux transporter metallochaperone ArsD [Loigolactobacillus backii]PIO84194.1 arsenical resistance operon transcriptional repressor ArsD [Loigolactobacillus backii]